MVVTRPDPSDRTGVAIITSSHWDGDPRLNRHARYLEAAGHQVDFESFRGEGRVTALFKAMGAVWATESRYVILPDPDLFVPGSLAALLSGKRPIIDIHENYSKVAAARPWIPEVLRPTISMLARIATRIGRMMAWKVVVAAPQLANAKDAVVLNIPDPESFSVRGNLNSTTLLYIGDVTVARGALDMVKVLDHLDESFRLTLVGRVDDQTRLLISTLTRQTGTQDRVDIIGELPHSEAWKIAGEALVGLSLLQDVPAYRDAVGTKLWEYMAVGLPPVVSRLPGQARLVTQLDPDLVSATPEDAARIIKDLSNDSGRLRKVSLDARSLVESEWSHHRPDLAIQGVLTP